MIDAVVVDLALAAQRNGIVEFADPERAPFNEIVARYLKAVGDPRQVVSDPGARYWGGAGSRSARWCRWAKRASAISVPTNGCVAHRQKPDPPSEVHPQISPARRELGGRSSPSRKH